MYDASQSDVTSALHNSNPAIFSGTTINQILALTTGDNGTTQFTSAAPDANGQVTVAAGSEVVLIASSDTVQTTLTAPSNAPVVIFQGKGGVIATFNDASATVPASSGVVDRIVVGSSGNDHIVISDTKNTKILLGTGNSTVVTGSGSDTVEAGLGNSTISGGTGHTIVTLKGNASDYTVTVQNGHAVVTGGSNDTTTDISKIQYVQLDNGKALVFAKDSSEAAITTLYETTFGRTADAAGLKYWFDMGKAGATLQQIADGFTHSTEFAAQSAQSNTDFVNSLYQHTFGRAADAGGAEYWNDALAHGATRADLIQSFADIAGQNIAGTVHTEASVVGSVTIVTNIV